MNEKILVLSVGSPYDIAPESGGEHVTGCTMWYLPVSDVTKKNIDEDSGVLGYVPVKEKMKTEFYNRAKEVGLPAVATVVYGMKNSGGKQMIYIKGLDFDKK